MPIRCLVSSLSPALWAVIAFALLLAAINRDSMDMDEAQTWDYARLGTFSSFCHELKTDPNSEAQMPLGMVSFWAWSRVFGTGEVAMRSLNLFWAALALAALALAGRQLSIPWLPLLFGIQPFVWYSMNQARTPLMQMAGGALLLAGAVGGLKRPALAGCDAALLCAGAIVLCGASMLGSVTLLAVSCGLAWQGAWRSRRFSLAEKLLFLTTAVLLAAFGLYYSSTLLRGAGGAKIWAVSPANLFFAGYEFSGFQGLGPGRQEIRAMMKGLEPASGILPFIPGMLALALAYLTVAGSAAKSWLTRKFQPPCAPVGSNGFSKAGPFFSPDLSSAWLMGIGVSLGSGLLLFLLAVAVGFPFWGRHVAGAFPFWVMALAITLHGAGQGVWGKPGRLASLGLPVLLLLSSLLIRFAPVHRHDDYRGAAVEAERLAGRGRAVWWVADYSGGAYYGLPLSQISPSQPPASPRSATGEILFASNQSSTPRNFPDAILLSRPDNFDRSGTATRILAAGGYTKTRSLQAFDLWERQQ